MDNIFLIYDKTGFPLIEIKEMKLFVHAIPVTKLQFEKFMTACNLPDFGDSWYEDILKLNPRVSYREFSKENYWKLFITGVYPEEAIKFAKYLGNEYRLPTLEEWCYIYKYFRDNPLHFEVKEKEDKFGIFKRLENFLGNNLFALTFMKRGIAEWVKEGEGYVGVGKPDSGFYPNAWSPLYDFMRPSEKERYLFSWNEIPGNDSGRLINFLKQEYGIDWVETAKIEKIDRGNCIKVFNEEKYLLLRLNNKTKVILEIDDGRTKEFLVKTKNGTLNIYRERLYFYFIGFRLVKDM